MQKLQDKLKRVFADPLLYVYVRPTGIIEVRKKTLTAMKNDLVIKRWQKWTPIDRIIYELWERDTWSHNLGQYGAIDDHQRLKRAKTVSDQKELERLNRMVAKQNRKRGVQ